MRRVLALLTVLSLLVFSFPVAAGPTEAQIVTWVRGYPQEGTSGCVEYVAQWSDGSFTWTPWACPPGVVARTETATAVRSYPQRAANGCVEFVNQWSDETYTWVPFECPPGVVYYKPPIEPEPTIAVEATLPPTSSATGPVPVAPPEEAEPVGPPPIAPPPPDTDVPSVRFVNVQGASPGDDATATVETTPGAVCTIDYTTPEGTPGTGADLTTMTAGPDGRASWTWQIAENTPGGNGTVMATCHGLSATAPIAIG